MLKFNQDSFQSIFLTVYFVVANFDFYKFKESYDRAKSILNVHQKEHKLLAEALLKYETLDAEDIKALLSKKS